MKKIVNGQLINVDNMELFELAAEGLAIQKSICSNTSDGISGEVNSQLVRKYIKQYDIFLKAMPYPLYAIERNIKYATIANFIQSLSKSKIVMWIEDGLIIYIDKSTGMALKLVNNTWGIVNIREVKEDNTSLELYRDDIGYKEYSWILKKVMNKETTANYYSEFMPEFVKACNNQPMILKWELENMLTYSRIPESMELNQDKIIDIDRNREFILDIYFTANVKTDEKIETISFHNGTVSIGERYKTVKAYNYDLYVKDKADEGSKLEKYSLVGFNKLFSLLYSIKNADGLDKFPEFKGVMCNNKIIVIIDNILYIMKSNRMSEAIKIASNVDLYTVENGKVFFKKRKRVTENIYKESLYSYSITDTKIRLCKEIYTY